MLQQSAHLPFILLRITRPLLLQQEYSPNNIQSFFILVTPTIIKLVQNGNAEFRLKFAEYGRCIGSGQASEGRAVDDWTCVLLGKENRTV